MRVTLLGSSSSGNSLLVEGSGGCLLVDAGLAPRDLAQRLERSGCGRRLDDVRALLVTHEHADHAVSAGALAAAGVAVHASAGTVAALALGAASPLRAGEPVVVLGLQVTAVRLPHDAAEPTGFVVAEGDSRLGVLTDIGAPTPEILEAAAGCHLLILEANHDLAMLHGGPYPEPLRRRIAGPLGHLANDEAAEILRRLAAPQVRTLVLGHLSETNNQPELARAAARRGVSGWARPPQIVVAAARQPCGPFELRDGEVRGPLSDGRQLRLDLGAPRREP